MRPLFSLLSAAYIAGIFVLADSPFTQGLSKFNSYSLFHIPLYGLLTMLLILSLVPLGFHSIRPSLSNDPGQVKIRLLLVSLIALTVAISDEIYQAYLPARESSLADVLLDSVGIGFVTTIRLGLSKPRQP